MKIDRTISLGSLINLASILGVLVVWLASVNAGQAALQETRQTVSVHTEQLAEQGKNINALSGRVNTLERLGETWQRDIVRRLERIEDKLDRGGTR